ncbi:hypothetical protein Acsp05_31390 [Actinokineospora sp. NBRC 105648]|nr:hypothetical protein Acsp05_31390 [Actinokineospora sp. NBRC 105648]
MVSPGAAATAVQIRWGRSSYYRRRVHLTPQGMSVGFCGMPLDRVDDRRPVGVLCPECALGFVNVAFPQPFPQPGGGR